MPETTFAVQPNWSILWVALLPLWFVFLGVRAIVKKKITMPARYDRKRIYEGQEAVGHGWTLVILGLVLFAFGCLAVAITGHA